MAKGAKTGGRQKGTQNKATAQKAAEVAESGLTPLDYMLSVMRNDQNATDVRLDAAHKAAPYVHPKLSQIDANVNGRFDLRRFMLDAMEDGDGD